MVAVLVWLVGGLRGEGMVVLKGKGGGVTGLPPTPPQSQSPRLPIRTEKRETERERDNHSEDKYVQYIEDLK